GSLAEERLGVGDLDRHVPPEGQQPLVEPQLEEARGAVVISVLVAGRGAAGSRDRDGPPPRVVLELPPGDPGERRLLALQLDPLLLARARAEAAQAPRPHRSRPAGRLPRPLPLLSL